VAGSTRMTTYWTSAVGIVETDRTRGGVGVVASNERTHGADPGRSTDGALVVGTRPASARATRIGSVTGGVPSATIEWSHPCDPKAET
jgi:hypothetical protein